MYIVVYDSKMNIVGIVNDVEYEINKRVYDLDTSSFAGVIDEIIEDPFFFLFKNDDFEYAGWIKNFKQDGKLVTFNGVDLKSIIDTEVELDFNKTDKNFFRLDGMLDFVLNSAETSGIHHEFIIPNDNTDVVDIGNYTFQVVITNVMGFIKPYLVLNDYYLDFTFDEGMHEIFIYVLKNNNTMKIKKDDFVLEINKTTTKTNHAVATLIQIQEEDRKQEVDFIPTSKTYYENSGMTKKDASGRFLTIPVEENIKFETVKVFSSGIHFHDDYIALYIRNSYNQYIYLEENWGGKFWLYIPYYDKFSFKSYSNRRDNDVGAEMVMLEDAGLIGLQLVTYLSLTDGMTSPYTQNIRLQQHNFTEFGEGWFFIDTSQSHPVGEYPHQDIRIYIPLKEPISSQVEENELRNYLSNNVLLTRSQNEDRLGTYRENKYDYNRNYAKPYIELQDENTLRNSLYKVEVKGFSAERKRNGVTSAVIPDGEKVFNIVDGNTNIPLDRIKVWAGTTEATSAIIFEKGKFIEHPMAEIIKPIDYDILENGNILRIDFGGWGHLTIDENFVFSASGQGGWYYKLEVEPLERYWQVGQTVKRTKRLLRKNYYLGKNNEVYEGTIPANQKISPTKTKIFQDEFLYNAQRKAITELVNSRYDLSLMVFDNNKINPYSLSKLGLLAKVEVEDKNKNTIVLPISEIIYSNTREQQVKLGFKKMLFTEIIKGE